MCRLSHLHCAAEPIEARAQVCNRCWCKRSAFLLYRIDIDLAARHCRPDNDPTPRPAAAGHPTATCKLGRAEVHAERLTRLVVLHKRCGLMILPLCTPISSSIQGVHGMGLFLTQLKIRLQACRCAEAQSAACNRVARDPLLRAFRACWPPRAGRPSVS